MDRGDPETARFWVKARQPGGEAFGMQHRNSHFAVGYWSRLRRGRRVPDQADIDPKALKRILPFVFLLDGRPDGRFVYRLAGTGLCERYGTEMRGLSFLAMWDTASRPRLAADMRDSLAAALPLSVCSIGATQDCRMVEIETILMPLTNGSPAPHQFFGLASLTSEPTAVAGRVMRFERLVDSSLLREECPDTPGVVIPAAQLAQPRAPHLRLVVSQ